MLVDPSKTIPISVTGSRCPLNCPHCGGKYLSHMIKPGEMEAYIKEGYRSFLISGGMLPNGEIPFKPFLDLFRRLKKEYKLFYNFHVGFPRRFPDEVDELADVVSMDFFGDQEILKKIYSLTRDLNDLISFALTLSKPVVPHVTIGIFKGEITHEFKTLKILSEYFDTIVLNVFIPTPGTPFGAFPPPDIKDVKEVFKKARKLFKRVILGCMQPRGSYRKRLQEEVKDLVDVIVKPVIKIEGEKFEGCCAFLAIELNEYNRISMSKIWLQNE
ncbi:MAG: radical SAM protein [Thermotogae bacterium]|nr:MAG: radical SAM protein [Thermotogota bacterium]